MSNAQSKDQYDLQKLQQVLDTVFSPRMRSKNSSVVVKSKLTAGDEFDVLTLTYIAVVNFKSEHEKIAMKTRFDEESLKYVESCLKLIKSEYTEVTDGDKISTKLIGSDITIELLSCSAYNFKKSAYYRRAVSYELK